MVVAEVPLWVVHSSGSSSVENEEAERDGSLARAQESLSLLDTIGGGRSQRCAIYALDMHRDGSKFATGGGDGTVRIWSSSALFAKYSGSFVSGGNYESSDSSGMEEMENKEQQQNQTELHKKNDSLDAKSERVDVEVNDLNSLVRRKKGSQATITSPSTTNTPHPLPSPSRQKRDIPNRHRLLCTLSAHTGSSVLAVRFSTSGRYLASAGDDAAVCVYSQSSSSSGGNLSENVEHWQRVKLCRGHTLDVVGLAWAPDDSHLVSCSLDSDAPIIVWKLTDLESQERRTQSNVLCNPYKILGKRVHTSTVKGVTFDPAGSYFASSGDDPAVCIWRAHDDWGLEKRLDADSGIFRKWKEGDVKELSSQTLFRRLSWSTDGAYICSTNALIKNKHVASTISREGWNVSSSRSTASGAANLVGHKQPVVVSRHCPRLLNTKPTQENGSTANADEEPDYATLIALGDKRGFVTIWSTRKSRPLFKLQCSESRCTVTDLAWGGVGNHMVLLVSLLDGHLVALRFDVPREIGILLSGEDQKRVFELRYGIDFDNDNGLRRGRMFVGDTKISGLIENALQFTLEDQDDEVSKEGETSFDREGENHNDECDETLGDSPPPSKHKVKGKKRIRPVLMTLPRKRGKQHEDFDEGKKERKKTDVVKDALDLAAKAASAVDDVVTPKRIGGSSPHVDTVQDRNQHNIHSHQNSKSQQLMTSLINRQSLSTLPHSLERIHSLSLPLLQGSLSEAMLSDDQPSLVVDCTNSNRVPNGSSEPPLPCITISISDRGRKKWKDDIIGTSCTAIAASQMIFAVGTADGCLYFYGTSPAMGWICGSAFKSHPPLIVGHAIVSLQMIDSKINSASEPGADIVVVSADGMFGVYSIYSSLKLKFKGTILPPMTHMVLGASLGSDPTQPKLARIQLTEKGHLFMILSISSSRSEGAPKSGHAPHPISPGGSLQAFVYDKNTELWMRVSDSRFVLSDFYTTLPSNEARSRGTLAKIDDACKIGAAASSIRPSRRGRAPNETQNTASMYNEQDCSNGITLSHCEDRMACSLALSSANEFRFWLSRYVKHLTITGNESHLRLLAEMLLLSSDKSKLSGNTLCWWLSSAPAILSLSRKELVQDIVIPEMSKNRALQRLMNEVSLDIQTSS